jgi:hypothetical protein
MITSHQTNPRNEVDQIMAGTIKKKEILSRYHFKPDNKMVWIAQTQMPKSIRLIFTEQRIPAQ